MQLAALAPEMIVTRQIVTPKAVPRLPFEAPRAALVAHAAKAAPGHGTDDDAAAAARFLVLALLLLVVGLMGLLVI